MPRSKARPTTSTSTAAESARGVGPCRGGRVVRAIRHPVRDRRSPSERGSATIEFTIAVPLLFFLVVVIVQFGIWAHGSAVVRAAAQEAVRTTRVESGSTEAGTARAEEFLSRVGGSLAASATSPLIVVERDEDRAAARVDAAVVSLLPGIELRVHGEAVGTVERFRRLEERR